ncbi:MAG: 5-formyltetrahydrofolate cyclo-ligase [Gammaproteobacteria bacterium]|nr:5-formyltetrahydrofolate cyclo-ligase [Gammaproteobacteria bacterium]
MPEPPDDEREPFPPEAISVVLVPGLAFDGHGYRLGYGAGMYDRLFELLPPAALRWGLAFEAQLVDAVPTEPHDQPLDAVVTERRWITTEARHG